MNELLQNKISQKMAQVNLLEMYYENGRCQLHELTAAKAALAELMANIAPPPPPERQSNTPNAQPSPPISYEPDAPERQTDLMEVKHQLLMAHRELRLKEATLGNSLAMMDRTVVAADICEQLVGYAKKIEHVWDQYRFIERHGHLPSPADFTEKEELSPAEKEKLAQIKVDLRRLYDKRSKLKAKIDNPSAHAKSYANMQTKPAEWASEMAFVQKEITQLELVKLELEGA